MSAPGATLQAPSARGGPGVWRAVCAVGALVRRRALRICVLSYLALLVGLPVGYLLFKAFSPGWRAFSDAVTAPGAVAALELSGKIALVVVPVNTVVGILAATLIARRKVAGRRLLDLAFDVPVAVSPVVVGVALFFAYAERIGWFGPWLARNGIMLIFSPAGIAIASMAISLPYVLRSVAPVLVEVGESQEIAARTLGAGAARRFLTITLPSIRWGVLYGVTLTLARTLGEFGAVLIVSGNITGRTQTAPIYIADAWDQSYDQVSAFAVAVLLALFSVGILVVMSVLRARERRLHVDIA